MNYFEEYNGSPALQKAWSAKITEALRASGFTDSQVEVLAKFYMVRYPNSEEIAEMKGEPK